jgi:hypothetical protein
MSADAVRALVAEATEIKLEPPQPLMRELPPADDFPVDALGAVLSRAAHAIHDRVQAALAICGQSVLAAATLSVQAHADVVLPTDQARPLSMYLVSVAATGERKSAVDTQALAPVRLREATLRGIYGAEHLDYVNALDAWNAARSAVIKASKKDRTALETALKALGPEPKAPLQPILTCPEPTYEGMCRLLDDRFHEACVMDQADWWNGRVVGGFLVCARRNEELYYGRMAASGRIGHER